MLTELLKNLNHIDCILVGRYRLSLQRSMRTQKLRHKTWKFDLLKLLARAVQDTKVYLDALNSDAQKP